MKTHSTRKTPDPHCYDSLAAKDRSRMPNTQILCFFSLPSILCLYTHSNNLFLQSCAQGYIIMESLSPPGSGEERDEAVGQGNEGAASLFDNKEKEGVRAQDSAGRGVEEEEEEREEAHEKVDENRVALNTTTSSSPGRDIRERQIALRDIQCFIIIDLLQYLIM